MLGMIAQLRSFATFPARRRQTSSLNANLPFRGKHEGKSDLTLCRLLLIERLCIFGTRDPDFWAISARHDNQRHMWVATQIRTRSIIQSRQHRPQQIHTDANTNARLSCHPLTHWFIVISLLGLCRRGSGFDWKCIWMSWMQLWGNAQKCAFVSGDWSKQRGSDSSHEAEVSRSPPAAGAWVRRWGHGVSSIKCKCNPPPHPQRPAPWWRSRAPCGILLWQRDAVWLRPSSLCLLQPRPRTICSTQRA